MLASCGRVSCASGWARGRLGGRGKRPPSPWPDRSKGAKMAGRIGVHLGNRCEVLRPHSFRDRQCPSAFSPPLFSGRDNSLGEDIKRRFLFPRDGIQSPLSFPLHVIRCWVIRKGPFALKEGFAHSLLDNRLSELRIHRLGL